MIYKDTDLVSQWEVVLKQRKGCTEGVQWVSDRNLYYFGDLMDTIKNDANIPQAWDRDWETKSVSL